MPTKPRTRRPDELTMLLVDSRLYLRWLAISASLNPLEMCIRDRKMAAEVEGILLWAFEGLQRLVKNGFQFTESDRAKRNRELVKRDNNNVFDFLESEGYIRLKADACTSSKELYEVYKMWCEENSLNAIKARGFSDALIANQRRYNLESTNNIVNSSGRRVRGFVGIEALVQPDLTPNSWRV